MYFVGYFSFWFKRANVPRGDKKRKHVEQVDQYVPNIKTVVKSVFASDLGKNVAENLPIL